MAIARFERVRQAHRAALDGIVNVTDNETLAHLGDPAVAELDHFGEVVAGVHVQQRERQPAIEVAPCVPFLERLLGQPQDHARILAAREQQGGALEGGDGFAQDEDGFFLQPVEVRMVEFR